MSLCSSPVVERITYDTSSPPITLNPRLFVEIPRWQDHLRDDGSKYTTYEVVVRCHGKKWSLHKRYSEFSHLRESLLGQFQIVQEFDFPNKSKFNTFSNWTKERRRTGFEDFMTLLLGFPIRLPEVDDFLEVEYNMTDKKCVVDDTAATSSIKSSSYNHSPISNITSVSSNDTSERSSTTRSRNSKGSSSSSKILSHSPNPNGAKCIPKFPPLKADAALTPSRNDSDDLFNVKMGSKFIRDSKAKKGKLPIGMAVLGFIGAVAYSVWWLGGVVGIVSLSFGLIFGVSSKDKASASKVFSS